jgi:hypothetical protein
MKTIKIVLTIIIYSTIIIANSQGQDTSCVGQQGLIRWFVYADVDGNDLQDLYIDPSYPLSPTYDLDLEAIETTYSFNNLYGSIVKGFLKVPESGSYTFNVTGNNYATFFISEGTDPENKSMLATTLGACGKEEHYLWPEQTSTINLSADTYYYFELHHKEEMYSDHATVYWRTPFYSDTLWRVVNASYLYDYTCQQICPAQGTPCSDGMATTINDVQDGYCNCLGEEINTSSCVGRRGDVTAMIYDSISGSSLSSLYAAPKFPLEPDTALVLSEFRTAYYFGDTYGTLIKGYIRVPQSGLYQFNVTGDDNTQFFLSDGEDESNLSLMAEVPGWSSVTEHYKYPEQTSAEIYLDDGEFYYMELHHKEGWGGDHANVYWKTPFRPDTNWMIIQGLFLYEYDCELACIPEGTSCNDHDPQTTDDQYDANCNCTGTPCGGPCNQGNNYEYKNSCEPTENYTNNTMDSWLSCQLDPSPNPIRPASHWIMYDFGESLKIERTRFWNYNVENETAKGAKTVIIDYSDDGSSWSELGTYQWSEANGLNDYGGDSIPDLNGVVVRYLLFTITESWNDPACAGFSEILFEVRHCLPVGTPCDDEDALTIDDIYDDNCNCRGHLADPVNNCDTLVLILDQPSIANGDYNAEQTISSSTNIDIGQVVTYTAGESVELDAGFEVEVGASFYASIVPCIAPLEQMEMEPIQRKFKIPVDFNESIDYSEEYLRLKKYADNRWMDIEFNSKRKGPVSLYILNHEGKNIITFFDQFKLGGNEIFSKRIASQNMKPGVYTVVLETSSNVWRKRFVILEQ